MLIGKLLIISVHPFHSYEIGIIVVQPSWDLERIKLINMRIEIVGGA